MSESIEFDNIELREKIRSNLAAIESKPLLRESTIDLLNTLGYYSDKVSDANGSSPDAFLDMLASNDLDVDFNKEKALFDYWLKADLLFQITDDEFADQVSLFRQGQVRMGYLESYLFFSIELKDRGKDKGYARGELTTIARQLNRAFPMPVMVFIKHKDLLSIAVINRRVSRRDIKKDVLGKVAIIKDISLIEPHPGHLDILSSIAFPNLLTDRGKELTSFDTLHAAWEKIFNVELLNERFYKDIFKWYFWALDQVSFPDDLMPKKLPKNKKQQEEEKLRATGLIRLLTRLIFCWFLKEKSLIPDDLFNRDLIRKLLKSMKDDESTYYQAILQNLFFATLNQQMNVPGKQHRKFARDEGFHKNKDTYGIDNLYRYEAMFKSEKAAIKAFADIPFLNGGLFECLDYTNEKGKKIYVDGFSRNDKKRAVVPNQLFFGEGEVDVGAVTGETKRDPEKVRGLIDILSAYKFTITENTAIDQEVALDPELLGKVFENLLATYNDETKDTARRQTGSFYTPPRIVEYMVDESLKAYLTDVLKESAGLKSKVLRKNLDDLFSYSEKEHQFNFKEVDVLIKAIDNCKILDPACGSGAFPMGVLYRLVNLLTKLDPDNELWKQTQLDKLDSSSMRIDLEKTFANNNDDYGRKLYLIENCLYGVDIQPIAIQLSKLRFFISLICDQKTSNDKEDNYGIKPLPNLETKFVAADALIGIDGGKQPEIFRSSKIIELEVKIQKVRHNYFSVQNRQKKLKLQKEDKELRKALASELTEVLKQTRDGVETTSKRLADWDPYNVHYAADFFHPQWMFDKSVQGGFDIVIGNPPYRQIQKYDKEQKKQWVNQEYQTYSATADIYCLFYEKGTKLLRDGGHLCYITSNSWLRAAYGGKLREYLASHCAVQNLLDFGGIKVFNSATVDTGILLLKSTDKTVAIPSTRISKDYKPDLEISEFASANTANIQISATLSDSWVVIPKHNQKIKTVVEEQGESLENWCVSINRGIISGFGDAFFISTEQRESMISEDPSCKDIIVPMLRGRYVERYKHSWDETWLINTHNGIKRSNIPRIDALQHPPIMKHLSNFRKELEKRQDIGDEWYNLRNCAYLEDFQKPKILYPEITSKMPFYYDADSQFFANNKAFILTGDPDILPYLTAYFNSSLFRYCFKDNFPSLGLDGRELRKIFFEKIRVKKPTDYEALLFQKLVCFIQTGERLNDDKLGGCLYILDGIIDACVMECYFQDYMTEKSLSIQEDALILLEGFDPERSNDQEIVAAMMDFYKTANEPKHPIRNRLFRITTDSVDFLNPIRKRVWS